MEQTIEPADVDLEPAERTRQLITRLQDDEELGGLARIARHLMAAIHLPRAISDREDLPVGGVSDISNRGPLDRLAAQRAGPRRPHAGRAGRHERGPVSPPRDAAQQSAQASGRAAGLRRSLVGRAAGLRHGRGHGPGGRCPEANVRTDVFRAAGDGVVPVSLADRAGVVAHVEALEPDAHPGRSLAAFAATASAEAGLLDAVIVTSEDVAADHDFQRSLAALGIALACCWPRSAARAASAWCRKGGGEASSCGKRRSNWISCWPARPARSPGAADRPGGARRSAGDPLVCGRFRCCFPYQPFDPGRAWKAPWGGVLSISKDRCLFHWQAKGRGARLLSDCLPAGALLWTGLAAQGAVSLAVVGTLQQKMLWLVRIDSAADKCEARQARPARRPSPGGLRSCRHGLCSLSGSNRCFRNDKRFQDRVDAHSQRRILAAGPVFRHFVTMVRLLV